MDLTEAARELGVHYQTAYRWVRQGTLKAVKVGKGYRVEPGDLDEFARRRAAGRAPRSIEVRDWDAHVRRLYDALVDGDERAARKLVDRLTEGGLPFVDLGDRLIAPALRQIGAQWATGQVTIAEEHRASAICERLLARVPGRRTRAKGTAVVATPPGDRHALPALMAALALRHDGWRVHHLASDLPTEELGPFLRQHPADLVALSSTMPVQGNAEAAREAAAASGVPVLVGRPSDRLADLISAARGLHVSEHNSKCATDNSEAVESAEGRTTWSDHPREAMRS